MLVTISLGRGGAESHLVRIANALSKNYEVSIVVVRRNGTYLSQVSEEVSVFEIGSCLIKASTLVACHFASYKLANLINRWKPDCVISFLEPVTHACYRAKQMCHNPFIHLVAIQNNLDRSFQTLEGFFGKPVYHGVSKGIQNAEGIIAISEGVAGNVVQHFPDVAPRIRTIHNAAFENLPLMPVIQTGPAPGGTSRIKKHKIIACGRLTEQKGFCDLLDAFHLVKTEVNAELEILGTGPLLKSLTQQAHRLGISDDVRFAGFQDDPLSHFRDADLFVLSSWWEGFGNVIVEAMSVGTPVVSTDCLYGPSEIISDRQNGILVPTQSPEILANQIIAVLTDENLRTRLGSEGRERSKHFTAEIIASQYSDFIEEIEINR